MFQRVKKRKGRVAKRKKVNEQVELLRQSASENPIRVDCATRKA